MYSYSRKHLLSTITLDEQAIKIEMSLQCVCTKLCKNWNDNGVFKSMNEEIAMMSMKKYNFVEILCITVNCITSIFLILLF